MSDPVLNTNQPYGTIYGSGADETVPGARFHQNGSYFSASGAYLGPDGSKPKAIAAAPDSAANGAEKQTLPALEDAEVEELLKDPRAEKLLAMPRDQLTKLVEAANGPVIFGDGSHRSMAAFVLKHTAPSTDEL